MDFTIDAAHDYLYSQNLQKELVSYSISLLGFKQASTHMSSTRSLGQGDINFCKLGNGTYAFSPTSFITLSTESKGEKRKRRTKLGVKMHLIQNTKFVRIVAYCFLY